MHGFSKTLDPAESDGRVRMSGSGREEPYDGVLGMNAPICRRDFLNSALLASGRLLLSSVAPSHLIGADDWTGYGGVGDYSNSNGNTQEVVEAGHQIRDRAFEMRHANAIDTGEVFDCVVVGGGLSGLAAALCFQREGGEGLKCLVIENHPIFGGEAKRNEFIVDGQRLMAPQGSDHFQIPYPYSFIARFYESIGLDWRQFKYQSWEGPEPEIALGRTFEQMPEPKGYYFGAKFGQQPGVWLVKPWGRMLDAAPIPAFMRAELLNYAEKSSNSRLPFEHPGDEKARRLDGMTLETHLMQAYGLSRDAIRTMLLDSGGGFGAGPDVLSGYCAYAFQELHALDDSPETGWQSFPGGNAGLTRHMVKTLIPDSFPGPRTLEAVCRNDLNFAALDRPGQPSRIRLRSTAVRVEHDGDPDKSAFVWVT